MTYIVTSPVYTEHLTGLGHPESPQRVPAIEAALRKSNLLYPGNLLTPRIATNAELLLCHTQPYIDLVQREVAACEREAFLTTGDVVISKNSFQVASLAAGAALVAVDAVMSGIAHNAFCVIRPPGHHACSNLGMGFCIFNNAAIAARYVQQHYGLQRVLIVDWDVHHGNGTQAIFDADPSVFYFSTHQDGIYPGTGRSEDYGVGNAKHTKLNCPITAAANSKQKIFDAFQQQLLPAMERFRPEFVIISCGFDAHKDDPLGRLLLDDDDFFALTTIVKQIAEKYANGRLVSILEGGYNLQAIARASVKHVQALTK